MAISIRKSPLADRTEQDAIWARLNIVACLCLGFANIANGTTAGKLKSQATVPYRVDGTVYSKANTDDLWVLSGLTALTANQYQAVALYLDAAGTATIGAGTVVTNTVSAAAGRLAALAVAAAIPTTKSVIGVFVAGSSGSTDYTAALTSQGTLYHGIPTGYGTPAVADVVTLITA